MNTTSSRRPKHLPFEVDATQQQPLGMPADRFLRDYWHKRPLLIRNAFPDFETRCNRKTSPAWPAKRACWRA